jgi:tetratricopeptide (TPR) repeat protein
MLASLSLALVSFALVGPVRAQPAPPDEEVAKRHFESGSAYYEAGKYTQALVEFEEADRIYPSPAFDFNVGRVQERLEHWREAADAFERYLAKTPDAPDEIRARVRVLLARASRAPKPVYKRWWLWTTVGVVVAAGVATGLTLGLVPRDAQHRPARTPFTSVRPEDRDACPRDPRLLVCGRLRAGNQHAQPHRDHRLADRRGPAIALRTSPIRTASRSWRPSRAS